jgi:hypothetical protein
VTFEPSGTDTSNEWLEAVDDETYGELKKWRLSEIGNL